MKDCVNCPYWDPAEEECMIALELEEDPEDFSQFCMFNE